MFEFIGILASLFVLVSFLMKKIRTIRIVNIVGAALFVVYGICINSISTWFLNGALIVIHLIFLLKSKIANKNNIAQ